MTFELYHFYFLIRSVSRCQITGLLTIASITRVVTRQFTFSMQMFFPKICASILYRVQKQLSDMESLLFYSSEYQIVICTVCKYALRQGTNGIAVHLSMRHGELFANSRELRSYAKRLSLCKQRLPETVKMMCIPSETLPINHLKLYSDGLACMLCLAEPKIYRSTDYMRHHLKTEHQWNKDRPKGRQKYLDQQVYILFDSVTRPVQCQTFYPTGGLCRYFEVDGRSDNDRARASQPRLQPEISLRDQIKQDLAQKTQAISKSQDVIVTLPHEVDVSPWLEMTRWPQYLRGQKLLVVARVAELPPRASPQPLGLHDTILGELIRSFDRVIEAARESILTEKVNIFDQHRINSFIRRKSSEKPMFFKLQEGTYKKYKEVWQRLLCYVYRLVVLKQCNDLNYLITDQQSAALDQVVLAAQSYIRDAAQINTEQLDRACLLFCVSLLDHRLRGNIYDSVVVGFLAVLGINTQDDRFHEAIRYTSHLSAFVKMAQMLVIERAVLAADLGEVEYPADVLDEMRDRFMIYGSNSPMNWVLKLRAYGKKIRDSSTGLGYIIWSEDGSAISYKDTELSMAGLRGFVQQQIELAQSALEDLLLVHSEEDRADVIPPLVLRDLKDDPSNNQRGWSFLNHPQNQALQGKEQWLLNRVVDNDWLHEEFFLTQALGKWRKASVQQYFRRVDCFLERILLLVHITSGQPARGTEILSLRVSNTLHGIRRNIFIENGLVSFVTFYHKGYSISGSTKIIHRYLPREVGELLIYYLWLIRPFCNQLRLLAFSAAAPPSSFLWARGDKEDDNWESARLSTVLAREFHIHLHTVMNITIWRHIAVAISRQHLRNGQFKRDYDVVESYADHQTAHTSLMAGNVYARLLGEAPGHVALARQQYRIVSREWQSFLGFDAYLRSRDFALYDSFAQTLNMSSHSNLDISRKRKLVNLVDDDQENKQARDPVLQRSNYIEMQQKVRIDLVQQNQQFMRAVKRRRRFNTMRNVISNEKKSV
jgi:hypothetical protein